MDREGEKMEFRAKEKGMLRVRKRKRKRGRGTWKSTRYKALEKMRGGPWAYYLVLEQLQTTAPCMFERVWHRSGEIHVASVPQCSLKRPSTHPVSRW